MKKLLAIFLTICMLASMLCVTAFAESSVIKVQFDSETKTFDNFEDGWNYAMEQANADKKVYVTLLTDWNAEDGEFTDDWIGGDGFKNDTIYIPDDAIVTLDLNGHTIDRGLTKDIDDGEVIYIDEDADVIIKDGTITGGNSNSEGGCLYIEGAKVTLNNVHIVGNRVRNDNAAGIYAYDNSTIIVNGGSFRDNVTTLRTSKVLSAGNAVYLDDSTATFTGVEFKNNKHSDRGVAIYAEDSTVTIDKCIFDGNTGGRSLIHGDDSSVTITNSILKNNTSLHVVEADDSIMTIDTSVFSNNKGTNMINAHDGSSSLFYVTNSQFTDNGSGVMEALDRTLADGSYFRNCEFNNNNSVGTSNGLPIKPFSGNFAKVTFYNCSFGDSDFTQAKNMKIQYSDKSAEEAVAGVTLHNKNGTEEFIACKFFDYAWNLATESAKQADIVSATIDFYDDWNAVNGVFGTWENSFKNNTIYVPSNTKITLNLKDHTIDRGLTDVIEDGEVIYVDAGAELTINDGNITGGFSNSGPAGIYIKGNNATVTLNNVNVINNRMKNDYGAGIGIYGNATLIMNGGSISDNVSIYGFYLGTLQGGALYVDNSTAVLTDVILKNNSLEGEYEGSMYGSAIYSTDSTVTLIDCTVESNGITSDNADYFCATTVYAEDSTLVFENTNFIDNGSKNIWQRSYYSDEHYASAVIYAKDTDITIIGGKFTDNKQVFLVSLWDAVANVDGVDFTGNDSLALIVYAASSVSSTFSNCKFGAGSAYDDFKNDFLFEVDETGITFVDCDFGKATFNDKNAVKFVGGTVSNGIGSMFGEGSLTMIVSFVALIASVAAIIVNFSSKKNNASVPKNEAITEDEE